MIDYTYLRSDLRNFESKLNELKIALHIHDQQLRLEELQNISQDQDFWKDQELAINVQSEISKIDKSISSYLELMDEYEDLFVLIELATESNDNDISEEINVAIENFKNKYEKIYMQTLFTGQYDANNAFLSLQAGAGGTEAMDWVEILLRMYQRYADKHNYDFKINDIIPGEEAGIKSVNFSIVGEFAYGNLKSEMGVHRLVRISPFDSSGRRHTSFASLEIIPEIDNKLEIEINSDDLKIDTYRASGAGGQHVNKTSSAVRITHIPTGIVTSSQAERSQFQNKDNAMSQLKSKLVALAEKYNKEKIDDLKGEQLDIAWGSQIRSYIFQPYTMVKDHRTNYEEGDVNSVIDGNIEGFINSYLSSNNNEGN